MPGSGSRMAISDHPATSIDGEVRFVAQLSRAILAGNQGRLWIGLAHVRLIGELTSPFSFSKVVVAVLIAPQFAGIRIPTRHCIFPRAPDGRSLAEPLIVSIDLSEIGFLPRGATIGSGGGTP